MPCPHWDSSRSLILNLQRRPLSEAFHPGIQDQLMIWVSPGHWEPSGLFRSLRTPRYKCPHKKLISVLGQHEVLLFARQFGPESFQCLNCPETKDSLLGQARSLVPRLTRLFFQSPEWVLIVWV